jgi:hypothetical protein
METTSTDSHRALSRFTHAHPEILIVTGLVLVLAAPLIPVFKNARVAQAQAELSEVDSRVQLDMDDLKRSQEKEQRADIEAAERENATPISYSQKPEAIQQQQQLRATSQEKRKENERNRQKALEDKAEELKQKYDVNALKRSLIDAHLSASGMRWPYVLLFLGNVILLMGLMIWTLAAEGVRQKMAFIILLVVLLGALSNFGVSLSLGARSAVAEHLSTP